jgi:hypothetical protein
LLYFVRVFNGSCYRDKKVVGVFVRFFVRRFLQDGYKSIVPVKRIHLWQCIIQ